MPIGIITFDIIDPNDCIVVTWHRYPPHDFPPTFVGEKYNNILTIAREGDYTNFYECPIFYLPVELLAFQAAYDNRTVLLKWETATENNNDRFEIERSTDGVNFQKIGYVKGAGSSTTPKSYNYIDGRAYLLEAKTFYYRLKQYDVDGQYTTSTIKAIHIPPTTQELSIFPNPVNEALSIHLPSFTEGSISIINELGQTLLQVDTSPLQKEYTLPLQNLPNGVYWLKLVEGQKVRSRKIIKQ